MSEMIDRVAVIIKEASIGDKYAVDDQYWRSHARAAINATREPTKKMIIAFYEEFIEPPDPNDFTPELTKAINAMIDEALKD